MSTSILEHFIKVANGEIIFKTILLNQMILFLEAWCIVIINY